MINSPPTDLPHGDRKPQLLVRFLAVTICILAGILIIQVVILVRNVAFSSGSGRQTIFDGNYVITLTSCGFVKGLVVNESFAFLGIQYAIPPLGIRRWTNAEVHDDLDKCWNRTYLAVERRKKCWQFYRNGSYDGAEDCLYLDVYSPQLHYQNPLDVIVFVGGDNLNGGESFELQPSAPLAKSRNSVFVSVSLRRSVLGFLSLKALSQRSRLYSSGNYGVSDLQAALLWVHLNIHHFGGNPESVTILGHQSGATVVGALLRSVYASPLFHKVWMSGGRFMEPLTLEQANQENQKFIEHTECENLDCLFKLSPEELLESVPINWRQFHQDLPPSFEDEEHFWLVYDGHILRNPKAENVEVSNNKNVPPIPVVVGVPHHVDASYEMRTYLNWNITEKYREYLELSFETRFAVQVYHQYNRPDTNHWQQFSAMLSDYRTICPMLAMSRKYFSKSLVFNYISTHRNKGGIGNLAKSGSDIQAIFRLNSPRSFKEAKFTENMISLFYSFVKTGSMDNAGSVKNEFPKILMVDDRIGKAQEYSNCDLWYRYFELRTTPKNSPTVKLNIEDSEHSTANDAVETIPENSETSATVENLSIEYAINLTVKEVNNSTMEDTIESMIENAENSTTLMNSTIEYVESSTMDYSLENNIENAKYITKTEYRSHKR